jgi:hypothetical protein
VRGTSHQWLPPVILVTQEAEKRRTVVEASQGKEFRRQYIEKTHQKKS